LCTTPTIVTKGGGSPETTVRIRSTSERSAVAPPATLAVNDAVDGPVMRYPKPFDSGEGLAAEVRGVLELDGACVYVALDEVGERCPILWPAGTRWDEQNQAVISATGDPMAIGDEVYGGGGYLCVADVARVAGPQASSLAADCVDNTYGEIAIVTHSDSAIGPAQN
jgi:hypothetical protein